MTLQIPFPTKSRRGKY